MQNYVYDCLLTSKVHVLTASVIQQQEEKTEYIVLWEV
jgi:hypothetical protein